MRTPFVSVIIPVLNDPERLKTCLEALEGQTYPKALYEVVVVDNGSDEGIESLVAGFPQARAAHESRRSSYAARNRGLALARGDVIAFTDSDCIPARDWIEKGVANLLRTPNCGLVAGRIELFFKDPDHPTGVELYESLTAFGQKSSVEHDRFGVTANLFTTRRVFADVGAFDGDLTSGGDYEWGQRVSSSGYELVYADDACVDHPARHTLDQLRRKVRRVIAGHHDLKRKKAYPRARYLADLARDIFPPLKPICRACSDKKIRGIKQKAKVIAVAFAAKYVRALERVRLQLAAKPKKRVV